MFKLKIGQQLKQRDIVTISNEIVYGVKHDLLCTYWSYCDCKLTNVYTSFVYM